MIALYQILAHTLNVSTLMMILRDKHTTSFSKWRMTILFALTAFILEAPPSALGVETDRPYASSFLCFLAEIHFAIVPACLGWDPGEESIEFTAFQIRTFGFIALGLMFVFVDMALKTL